MPPVHERMILIFILIIICFATLLCLIGLSTQGWDGHSIFSGSAVSSTLCIISLLLLISCIVLAAMILSGIILHQRLPFIFISLLIISSIIILSAFTSFFFTINNYSYGLMVASFTFIYLSSIIATYWLFGLRGTHEKIIMSGKHLRPKLDILT